MKIAYLDCSTGISGDMTLTALIDSGVDFEKIQAGIASLNLPEVEIEVRDVIKKGFRAKGLQIRHPEQHAHRHLQDITQLIHAAEKITPNQKELAEKIFVNLAAAEAKVHGSTIEKIHFHEVGAIDSIVDIVGVAIGFDLLAVDRVIASPVPTGHGEVKIAHGICQVPTPGTAELLKGIPLVDVAIDSELTTPTGAAILKTLVNDFGPMPSMTIEQIGYGSGTRDFAERANILRLFVGKDHSAQSSSPHEVDQVYVVETNLDDISAEIIGFTKQRLLNSGALDVFTQPIQMKKDRPGVILSLICQPDDLHMLVNILFQETKTLGVRYYPVQRFKRFRKAYRVTTDWGEILGKISWNQTENSVSFLPEFDCCAQVASTKQIPLHVIYQAAETSFQQQFSPTEFFKNDLSLPSD